MKYPPRSTGLVRPVFGLDIDGTLGDYHTHFIEFAENWLGKEMRWPYDGSVPFHKWIGVSKTTYRQIKLAYRRGGLKRWMPCYEGASDLSLALRGVGALVVICTTRPYLQLENIEPDTREWLRRNRIQYDGIISGEHKYRTLAAMYGKDRIVSVLEDLPALVAQAERIGLPWVQVTRKHNENTPHTLTQNGCYVSDLRMAETTMLNRLYDWEEARK